MDSGLFSGLFGALIGACIGAVLLRRASEDHRLVDAYAEWLFVAEELFDSTVQYFAQDLDELVITRRREIERRFARAKKEFGRHFMRLQIMERSSLMIEQIEAMRSVLAITVEDLYNDELMAWKEEQDKGAVFYMRRKSFDSLRNDIIVHLKGRTVS